MLGRRLFLSLGVLGLCATGIERYSGASGPTDVTLEGYGGASHGGWVCGPSANVKYAGGGGAVRAHVNDSGDKSGFVVGAAGGAETRSYHLTDCGDCETPNDSVVPPSRVMGAGRAELGYDGKWVGVTAGAMLFQRWKEHDDRDPSIAGTPTLDLRFGKLAGLHGGLGVGSWSTPTLFRPTGYLTIGYDNPTGFGFDVHAGPSLSFDDEIGLRGDVRLKYAIDESIAIGLGAAIQGDRAYPEGTGFLIITP